MNNLAVKFGSLSSLLCTLTLGCGSSMNPPEVASSGSVGAVAGSPGASGSESVASGGTNTVGGSPSMLGSSGSANSVGGSPTPPAPVVLPCPSLKSGEPTWERITPPGDVGDGQAIRVHPTESGTVFVMMHKGGNGAHSPTDGLYKSKDCGATWSSLLNTGKNGDTVATGSWWSFVIDPLDPNVIYTIDGYGAGGVWKSTNGGVDWIQTIPQEQAQYIPNLFLNGLAMDPTDHLHLVATVHDTCIGPSAGGCLPETFDGGATWHLIKGPDPGWAEGAGPIIIDKKRLLYATGFGGLSLSTDGGSTWKKVADSAYPFLYTAPDGNFFVTSNNGILKSGDGLSWTLVPGAGRVVPIVGGDKTLFAADQWSGSYYIADALNPSEVKKFTNAGMPESSQGAPFMAFDKEHHVLYSSNFAGGVWRIVTE